MPRHADSVARHGRGWTRLAVVATLFVASTSLLTHALHGDVQYVLRLNLRQAAMFVLPALGLLAAGLHRRVRGVYARLGTTAAAVMRIPAMPFLGGAVLSFGIAASVLSWVLFHHLPHVTDSQSLYIGAKVIASGHFTLPSHPLREFFDVQYVVNNGRYYSSYPPGHLLLLAGAHLTGMPWLLNPLLGAATVAVIQALATELADAATARIATLLALSSTFLLYMSSEYMSHATTLLCASAFLLCYVRTLRRESVAYAWLCGASIGMEFITRPQVALPFALPVVIHAMRWAGRQELRWRLLASGLASAAVFGGFFLFYNDITNGHPLLVGYRVGRSDSGEFLAHAARFLGPQGWIEGSRDLYRAFEQTAELQASLFRWPTYSLVFAALLFLCRAERPFCVLLACCCLAQAAALLLTPWNGGIFGPRYLYETAGAWIVLTALGLRRLPAMLRARLGLRAPRTALRGLVLAFVLLQVALSLPWMQRPAWRLYANHYFEGNYDYAERLLREVRAPALVFVEGDDIPGYGRAYPLLNFVSFTAPAGDRSPVIFVRDLPSRDWELVARMPGRNAYLADAAGARPLPPGR